MIKLIYLNYMILGFPDNIYIILLRCDIVIKLIVILIVFSDLYYVTNPLIFSMIRSN